MIGRVIQHRYRILSQLGEGGMGTVYVASDRLRKGKRIALKAIRAFADSPNRLDFLKLEFRLLTQLRHPHLAEVYDFGTLPQEGLFFFTSERVKGKDLLRVTESMGFPVLCELVVQICRVLDYIHSRGYVHYDIKPENILVTPAPARRSASPSGLRRASKESRRHAGLAGSSAPSRRRSPDPDRDAGACPWHIKLLDFGLAMRALAESPGDMRGSVYYMAPEILVGSPVDRRADLYSLGVTLYHVLTRRRPFEGSSNLQILRQHLEQPPVPPRQLRPEISAELEAIVLKLMAKRASDRFPTAGEVIKELQKITGVPYPLETAESGLSYVLTGALTGREGEMRLMEYAFTQRILSPQPAQDASPVLVLVGETGIGKTRLLNELRCMVQLNRIRYFSSNLWGGRAWEGETYGPLRPVFRQVLAEGISSEKRRTKLLEKYGADLARLLPAEEGLPVPPESASWRTAPSPGPEEKRRWMLSLAEFLFEVSHEDPFVLAVDDLQRADTGSLEFLELLVRALCGRTRYAESFDSAPEFTLRGPEGGPRSGQAEEGPGSGAEPLGPRLVLGLAWRPEEVDAREDRKTYRELVEIEGVRELALGPLSIEELRSFLGSMLGTREASETLVAAVHDSTGGNPLFVEEVMRQAIEENWMVFEAGQWKAIVPAALEGAEGTRALPIPRSITATLRARLRRLGAPSARILEPLSVAGRAMGIAELAELSALTPEACFGEIDRLLKGKFLLCRQQAGRDLFTLSHRAMADVVSSSLSSGRRTKLHRALGELLEKNRRELAVRAEELAFHFHRGRDRKRALLYSLMAARDAYRSHANASAIEHYQQALALCPPRRVALRRIVLERLLDVAEASGRYGMAEQFADLALKDIGRVGPDRPRSGADFDIQVVRARLFRKRGAVSFRLGRFEEAWGFYRNAKALLERISRGRPVSARSTRPQKFGPPQAARAAPQGPQPAQKGRNFYGRVRSTAKAELSQALCGMAEVLERKGKPDRALGYCRLALKLAEAHGTVAQAATIRKALANLLKTKGLFRQALAALEKAHEAHEELGDLRGIARVAVLRANLLQDRGQLAEAVGELREALRTYHRIGDPWGTGNALNNLGTAHLYLARWQEAFSYYQAALRIRRQIGDTAGMAATYCNLGSVLIAQRRHAEALENFRLALDLFQKLGEILNQPLVYLNQGFAHKNLGNLAAARENFVTALSLLEKTGNQQMTASACVNLCAIYYELGDFRKCCQYATRGLEAARRFDGARQMAQALWHLGDALAALGQHREAQRALARSLRISTRRNLKKEALHTWISSAQLGMQRPDYAQAVSALKEAFLLGRELGLLEELPSLTRLRAELEALRDSSPEGRAAASFREAIAQTERLGHLYEEALTHAAFAAFLEKASVPDQAQAHEAAAMAILEKISGTLPPDHEESFWSVPWRSALRASRPQDIPALADQPPASKT